MVGFLIFIGVVVAISVVIARVFFKQQSHFTNENSTTPTKPSSRLRLANAVFVLLIFCSIILILGSMGGWMQARGGMDYPPRYLADSLIAYRDAHDGNYPDPDKWSTLLYQYDDGYSFQYNLIREFNNNPEDNITRYVLNTAVVALGDKAPDDMVMLFIGPEGWNQSGGKDMLSGSGYTYITFVDGSCKHLPRNHALALNWGPNEPAYDLKPDTGLLIILSTFCVILGIYTFLNISYIISCFGCFLPILAPSLFLGILGGVAAEMAFYSPDSDHPSFSVIIFSLISAVLVAACYFIFIQKYKASGGIKLHLYLPWISVFAGVLSSSLVHLFLMYGYCLDCKVYLVIGCGFGFVAGLIICSITNSTILRQHRIKEQYANDADDECLYIDGKRVPWEQLPDME